MTITAGLHQWRQWTGLPFDTAGPIIVPGALVPIICDPQRDIATYIEPNAWIRHDIKQSTAAAQPPLGSRPS
jgi:hypothetical protein